MSKPVRPFLALVTIYTLALSAFAGDQAGSGKQVRSHGSRAQQVNTEQDIGPLDISHKAGTQDDIHQYLIRQSRGAYYSLTRRGFKGFKATLEPNWEVILAHTATPENLKVFHAVRFSMVVDASGAVTVSNDVNPNLITPKMQSFVQQVHYHVQRLVGGFFSTWRMFMVDSPFLESDLQIKSEDSGKDYRLTYRTEPGEVTILMTNDFLITEWRLESPRAKRTVKPLFQKTIEGFLLTGYQGIFEPITAGTKATLDFIIEYQDISGMRLPHKVRLGGMYGDEPVEAELVFRVTG